MVISTLESTLYVALFCFHVVQICLQHFLVLSSFSSLVLLLLFLQRDVSIFFFTSFTCSCTSSWLYPSIFHSCYAFWLKIRELYLRNSSPSSWLWHAVVSPNLTIHFIHGVARKLITEAGYGLIAAFTALLFIKGFIDTCEIPVEHRLLLALLENYILSKVLLYFLYIHCVHDFPFIKSNALQPLGSWK